MYKKKLAMDISNDKHEVSTEYGNGKRIVIS